MLLMVFSTAGVVTAAQQQQQAIVVQGTQIPFDGLKKCDKDKCCKDKDRCKDRDRCCKDKDRCKDRDRCCKDKDKCKCKHRHHKRFPRFDGMRRDGWDGY